MGFLPLVEVTKGPPAALVPNCGECGLVKKCQTPKFAVSGRGGRRVLIVADKVTETADKRKRWQSGGDGHTRLVETLAALGVNLDRDCWLAYAQSCHGFNKDAIKHCRPLLLNRIKELNPVAIVLLGAGPISSVIGHLWRNNIGKDVEDRWVGWRIPARPWNCWVCPTYSPEEVEDKAKFNGASTLWFKRHLKVAIDSTERPWKEKPPDYTDRCFLYDNDDSAVEAIEEVTRMAKAEGQPVAWDLETNCLKPDNKDAAIASCSMSIDRYAIAYPWTAATKDATVRFLKSPLRKIASNMKFEDRWAKRVIGCRVRNWWHDTMLAAHLLDNRKAVTSIKFQAFVHLGMEDYDSVVKPYLQAKESGGYAVNRVFRCDWQTMLRYNALDSLLEYEVAMIQRKLMFPNGEK